MTATKVLKACSYKTLNRFCGERARNVDELRSNQREAIINNRSKEKSTHLSERRHSLDFDEMSLVGRECSSNYQSQNNNHTTTQSLNLLRNDIINNFQNTQLVNALLEQNWPLIMEGLAHPNIGIVLETVNVLGSFQHYDPNTVRFLIQNGLLYKMRDLFRRDETRTISIALLNDLTLKTPSLISYILDFMHSDNICALFEEIFLMCDWSDIEQLIKFYHIALRILATPSTTQHFSNIHPSTNLERLLTPTIVQHIINYCTQTSMKSNENMLKLGLWIVCTTTSLACSSKDIDWAASIDKALDRVDIYKKMKKLVSSAKKAVKKSDVCPDLCPSPTLDSNSLNRLIQIGDYYLGEILTNQNAIKYRL